ncbi:hypothetical protein GCM10020001_037920 [Nonomuraea salmonea]
MNQAGTRRFRAYTSKHLDELLRRAGLGDDERLKVRAVATVLPFRTNAYVVDELIDWSAAPDDPIYRLVFPQEDMLPAADVARLADLLKAEAPNAEIQAEANRVRAQLNPHPAGQKELNVPKIGDEPVPGMQHKYPETVLFFPKQGQTCHAYCTYCFRWAQFVGDADLKFASDDIDQMVGYLRQHPEVTSVLITGGDAMIMGEPVIRRYIEPLLELEQLESIRIGTKALAYWPQRFTTDPDAGETMRLFEQVVAKGKNLAFMAHFSHPRELESSLVESAVKNILGSGATIRTQAPLIRSINDDPATWSSMWRRQHRMGMIPYYMFVERDTGPPRTTSRSRWRGRTRSSGTPTPRSPASAVRCVGRPCRPRRARSASTASPRSPARRCSCSTSSRPATRRWWGGPSSPATTRRRSG